MTHEVTMDVSTRIVRHKDVNIEVKKDGAKLGTLMISQGNIEWVPAGNYVNKKRLSWTQFADLMEERGRNIRMADKS